MCGERALAHIAEIRPKIAGLQAMERTLAMLVERCSGDDRPDCPSVDGLAS